MKFLVLFILSFNLYSQQEPDPKWNIEVQLYRGYPDAQKFKALKKLSEIAVEELSVGYLTGFKAYRQDFNGATFCLTVSPGLADRDFQYERILNRVKGLKPEGQFVHYNVVREAKCR